MDYNIQFDKLCKKLNLGEITANPEPLSGGFMNRMHSLFTNKQKYAVKALNPSVMLRPEAYGNYIFSEKIANHASKYVNVVLAKTYDNSFMQCIDNQYYIIFDWLEGITLYSDIITPQHTEIIGKELAKLHKVNFDEIELPEFTPDIDFFVDWAYFLHKGEEKNLPWVQILSSNIDNLYNYSEKLSASLKILAKKSILSHCDLDPKNVMWCDDKPFFIDWEAAGFINPVFDMLETCMSWSRDSSEVIQKDKFVSFANAYKNENNLDVSDWIPYLDGGFTNLLGWLEFSLKRSIGIECSDIAEQQLGTEHVFRQINVSNLLSASIPTLNEWLS